MEDDKNIGAKISDLELTKEALSLQKNDDWFYSLRSVSMAKSKTFTLFAV